MSRLFAALYDPFMARLEARDLQRRRVRLLADEHGRVLELGAGTGANLAARARSASAARALILVEPHPGMAARLRRRLREQPATIPRALVAARAEALPLADASIDTAVLTLLLCSVNDPGLVLTELRRVLKPDGRLLVLEHVRDPRPWRARLQRLVEPLWRPLADGCRLTRDTRAALEAAGFDTAGLRDERLSVGPVFLRPIIVGLARPRTALAEASPAG